MRLLSLLGLAALASASQLPLHAPAFSNPVTSEIPPVSSPLELPKNAKHAFLSVEDGAERRFSTFKSENAQAPKDVTYEMIQHASFPDYRLRLRRPQLCDPDVVQYSGYLDVSEDKHFFFWFFESRHKPAESPLVLWLNGGPGCSSSTGLLFELGPCSIADGGKSVSYNNNSWNSRANMLFLDQPVNVGWSYTDGPTVDNTPDAAEDVYAFLQLFVNRFNEYAELPFHIAAESFGGRYAPLFAASIHHHNKALSLAPIADVVPIYLTSVIIGNGMTDSLTQLAALPDYACRGPFPIYDDPEGPGCNKLQEKADICSRLIETCWKFDTKLTCKPASLYCYQNLDDPIVELGLNGYDVRKKCDREKDGELCYREMTWIENWMNNATVRAELGVNVREDRQFASCNMTVNEGFMFSGDMMRDSTVDIPEMLANGVRLLVYAGNADYMCNIIGNERWMLALKSHLQADFRAAPLADYRTLEGEIAGKVRSVGHGAGNFTYVDVFEAGHMVPFDQPEVALDMFTRWIKDIPLTL